jgi:hypothetical protein
MPKKNLKFRIKTLTDKKNMQKMAKIMNTMVPVSAHLYDYQKFDAKRIWINEDDYYEQVFVKKFNVYGLLFIYHSPDAKKYCCLDALFLPKKVMFDQEWERIKDKIIEIDYETEVSK